MRWLLVTALHDNPGDAFARVGVETLIHAVDPECNFLYIDKETQAMNEEIEFDRAVLCGMPLFWCHENHRCWHMGWWNSILNQFLGRDKRKLLIAGAGSFAPCREPFTSDKELLNQYAKKFVAKTWKTYARDQIVREITGLELEVFPCPSVFAVDRTIPKFRKLCNFMPDGAHYRHYGPEEATIWNKIRYPLLAKFRTEDWCFVAHNDREFKFARDNGFARNRILTDSKDPRYLLRIYSECDKYFGNRVHGAIVAAAAGADSVLCGYDSRLWAASIVGVKTLVPSVINNSKLDPWIKGDAKPAEFNREEEWNKQLKIFKEFADAE